MRKLLLGTAMTAALFLSYGCANNSPVEKTEQSEPVQNPLEQKAREKIVTLKSMMEEARNQGIDVTREETVIWFSEEFLKFANWDEANPEAIEAAFGYERYFEPDKERLARELPDIERRKVNDILDAAIDVLGQEMRGEISRRPVRKVDWQNTKAGDNMFVAAGKPVFPYDYFSKTVGQPLTNDAIYNDHLGALYHGGENLYPVDHDRAINSFWINEDGSFDEELLKELTQIPDTNIGYLSIWLMGIPEWVEEREPEIRKGRSLFQGFDLDNPLARDVWSKILRKSAEVTKDKKVIELGFVLANEPHWFSEKGHWTANFAEMNGISQYTLAEFQSWLSGKYNGDISALNTNWQTSFANFNSVEFDVPIDRSVRGQPIWFDWCRYNMHRSTDFFTFMQNELHAVNPDAATHIKIWPRSFYEDDRCHGIDVEALTELTTMIGHDAKALGDPSIRPQFSAEWNKKYAYDWKGMSILHDFVESVAPEKINVNSESHFLSSGMWKQIEIRTSYVRNVYWLATLQGMDANMGWFWARDPDGSPEDRLEGELDFFDPGLAGAFAGSVNMQPNVANEVTQVMFDLNSFSEEIIELRQQDRPLRFFYSETSAINAKDYMSRHGMLYESLFFEAFPLGYVTKNILETQDNALWDTVIVYKTDYVTDAEFNALQNYLNGGGTVVLATPDSLSLNEYGQPRGRTLTQGKGILVTLPANASLDDIKKAALAEVEDRMPEVLITEDNGADFKTTIWRSIKRDDGSYVVNILNLGHNTAKLDMTLSGSTDFYVKDLMTGNALSASLTLPSEGVLLLEVTPK